MNFGGKECRVGACIGVAIYPLHGMNGEAVLTAADNAMYQAKRNGKNRVVLAESAAG
jgi:diguanylate cyclase (GGDEF)-like protein